MHVQFSCMLQLQAATDDRPLSQVSNNEETEAENWLGLQGAKFRPASRMLPSVGVVRYVALHSAALLFRRNNPGTGFGFIEQGNVSPSISQRSAENSTPLFNFRPFALIWVYFSRPTQHESHVHRISKNGTLKDQGLSALLSFCHACNVDALLITKN